MEVVLGNGSGADARLLADYREWDGMVLPSGTTGSGWAARGLALLAAGTRSWWSSAGGAGVPTVDGSVVDAAGPGYEIQLGPATARTRFAPQWLMSWWQDYSLWPASFTRRLKVTMSAVVETSAPSSTEKPFIGMHNLGADLASGGPGQSGIQLVYDNGVTNSWRVRSRLTPLGALVNGNDSGIPAGVKLKVEFRYWQAAVPIVEVLVNGQVLQTFTGVAALPVPAVLPAFPAAATSGGFQPTIGVAGALGGNAVLIARQARYTVETLVP